MNLNDRTFEGVPIMKAALAGVLLALTGAGASESQIDVPEDAREAVAMVEKFSAALSAGDLDSAGSMLDPAVVILESGDAEHSAAEYLGGHAKHDAEFLKAVRQRLLRRVARATGDLAWVASENELRWDKDGTPKGAASTETVILRSGGSGWKIVHIHWSSHPLAVQ